MEEHIYMSKKLGQMWKEAIIRCF